MYAVVTQATIHDVEKARTILNEQGVPRMKQSPGFVSGTWVSLDQSHGRGIVVYDLRTLLAPQPR